LRHNRRVAQQRRCPHYREYMVDFPHKIQVPQYPGHLVSRLRLTNLVAGAGMERQLVVVTAPAGYGTTSLLIDVARTIQQRPVCWYTLDRFDAAPCSFLSYLTAAIQHCFPDSTPQTAALLAGGAPTPLQTVTATLVREVYAIGRGFVLILDDWHLVDH